MRNTKRWIALLLAIAMLAGMTACRKKSTAADVKIQTPSVVDQKVPVTEAATELQNLTVQDLDVSTPASEPVPDENGNIAVPVDTTDRKSLEQIVELLGSDKKPGKLNDKELGELAEDLLEDLENDQKTDGIVDLENQDQPVVDFDESAYDEDGAITKPFDQIYPELVENGQVEYDDETLLIKMKNSRKGKISDGMKKAGVAKLEAIVPMPDTTWYEAKLADGTDASKAVEELRKLKEVLLVEYNYEVHTTAIDEYKELPSDLGLGNNTSLSGQWYMNHLGIPEGYKAMTKPGGDPSVIVAVIDTGVDYDHEDLAGNIWTNKKEIPDNGIDDDGNGYIDDYYGVNIVSGTGNGDDDNGHGTHVAGIIAAENNNLGTVGIAYNVQIMPIKAAMASGILHQSDIAKAVIYAYENGAEVINMSFGGTSCSIAVQDALATAFTRSVLVASAGNDAMPNEGEPALPNYPAALTYVLGVMSVDRYGKLSLFSNYDLYPFTGIEYEVCAPGEQIMSTLPNNTYGILSGTSMAAPVVSAIAAIVRSEFTDRNTYPTRFVYGQLAAASEEIAELTPGNQKIANLHAALTKMPQPELGIQDYAFFDTKGFSQDTSDVNNGDGVLDAGETIALGLTLRNRWGQSKDTVVHVDTLSFAGIPDPYIEILNNDVNYGSIGSYATGDCGTIYTDEIMIGWEKPFYIRVAEDCPNDYIFNLNVTITCGNGMDEEDTKTYTEKGTIYIEVRNGVILPSVIQEDMTLTKDNLYIIPNATKIQKGVTVTVEPGTHIQFWSYDRGDPYAYNYIAALDVHGTFLVEGTKEEPIYIYPCEGMERYIVNITSGSDGYISMRYADVTNMTSSRIHYAERCTFRVNYDDRLLSRTFLNDRVSGYDVVGYNIAQLDIAKHCVFYKIASIHRVGVEGNLDTCIFVDCGMQFRASTENCVFLGNGADNAKSEYETDTYSRVDLIQPGISMDEMNDPVAVFYRPETGTTYLSAALYGGTMTHLIQTMGGEYAIIDDEDELNWICKTFESEQVHIALGVTYDHENKCFTWHDGSLIGEFLKAEEFLSEARPNQVIGLNYIGKTLQNAEQWDSSGFKYLYEIPGEILPTDITFATFDVTLDLESTYQIVPINEPTQLPLEAFIYESSDETVLKVSTTGLVTPSALGKADITVCSKDKAVWNHISFEVKDYVALEGISFLESQITVPVGERVACGAVLSPDNTTRRNVTYTTSNASVAEVDQAGNINGISSGTATITASCEGLRAQINVTVFRKATSLSMNDTYITNLEQDKTIPLPDFEVSKNAETKLQWSSSDTNVAEITDAGILLKNAGTTAIVLTDLYSDLSASQTLYVCGEARSPIVDLQAMSGGHYYALTEDGKLYSWGIYNTAPTILAENIMAFSAQERNLLILNKDGIVGERFLGDNGKLIVSTNYDQFVGRKPIGVHCFANNKFVWTEDGTVYAWGDDTDYGQLGIGHLDEQYTPMAVDLGGKVIQVESLNPMTFFLTDSGDLYVAGGINLQTATPVTVAQNVSNLSNFGREVVTFFIGDTTYRMSSYDITPVIDNTQLKPSEYDHLKSYGYYGYEIGAKGNQIDYRQGDEIKTLPGSFENITAVYNDYFGNFWFTTDENILYGFGANWRNAFGGATTQGSDVAVMIPIGVPNGELLKLTGTNLVDNTILTEETLILSFNKKMLTHEGLKLYADGEPIGATIQHKNNTIRISRAAGFKSGVTYKLIIGTTLAGTAGAKLDEDIEIIFTCQIPETEEIVIHQTQTDETLRELWSVESLREYLQQLQSELQIHESFYNNAILNRISTETDVNRWMRVYAVAGGQYSGLEIPIGGNWWGTTNETAIGLQLLDYTDFAYYGKLMYKPYLTVAPSNTFPFVTDVKVFGKDGKEVENAGMEELTIRVTFNRDMDTTIPLNVAFGSAYPYADYEVSEGKYINARTWEGKHFISSVMGNGYQYFSIGNGCSATDDLELFTDRMRFAFRVDTTAAQAMLMQGNATDTGIQLSWTQDDFDTLMGYNVYRSDAEDGYYTRINQTVIPSGTMEFFDDTVEPGKLYYYNFTVVKTDLAESAPSGKINLMSKDTMAPDIYHSPVYEAFSGENLIISATVTDNLSINYTKVHYRTTGTTSWKTAQMNHLNDKYSAIIPAADVTTAGLEYYLEAYDGVSHTYKGSADAPYQVAVKVAVSKNSLGDVNGDGKISNLDALMLLQAINDLLNLNAEQFLRADLNGNGILEAKEALRILQYVSGTVGSLKM